MLLEVPGLAQRLARIAQAKSQLPLRSLRLSLAAGGCQLFPVFRGGSGARPKWPYYFKTPGYSFWNLLSVIRNSSRPAAFLGIGRSPLNIRFTFVRPYPVMFMRSEMERPSTALSDLSHSEDRLISRPEWRRVPLSDSLGFECPVSDQSPSPDPPLSSFTALYYHFYFGFASVLVRLSVLNFPPKISPWSSRIGAMDSRDKW